MPSQEHYNTMSADDTLPSWNHHGEPLCAPAGRGPRLAYPHHSVFPSTSAWCDTTANQHTAPMAAFWIPSSAVYPDWDCSFTALPSAPGERHNGSFMTQTEAELIWR